MVALKGGRQMNLLDVGLQFEQRVKSVSLVETNLQTSVLAQMEDGNLQLFSVVGATCQEIVSG